MEIPINSDLKIGDIVHFGYETYIVGTNRKGERVYVDYPLRNTH